MKMKPIKPLFIIISSPSGAGKTTIANKLIKHSKFGKFTFSISHTTRLPRKGEKNGVHYYFIDKKDFRQMIKDGKFAEYALVHGNYYGTSMEEVKKRLKNKIDGIIFDIDYQGARQLKKKFPEALAIFILPPSIAELKRRLKKRGTENYASFKRRVIGALKEIKHYELFDYFIVNADLKQAYRQIKAIIIAHTHSIAFADDTVSRLIEEGEKTIKKI